jgi:hypothetical protein
MCGATGATTVFSNSATASLHIGSGMGTLGGTTAGAAWGWGAAENMGMNMVKIVEKDAEELTTLLAALAGSLAAGGGGRYVGTSALEGSRHAGHRNSVDACCCLVLR